MHSLFIFLELSFRLKCHPFLYLEFSCESVNYFNFVVWFFFLMPKIKEADAEFFSWMPPIVADFYAFLQQHTRTHTYVRKYILIDRLFILRRLSCSTPTVFYSFFPPTFLASRLLLNGSRSSEREGERPPPPPPPPTWAQAMLKRFSNPAGLRDSRHKS